MDQVYKLEGLCCPNCAMKIEKRMEEIQGFDDVSLNFATQTLTFVSDKKHHNYTELIQHEVNGIEDGVVVQLKVKDHIHHHVDEAIHDHDGQDNDYGHDHGHSHGAGEVKLTTWLRLGIGAVLFVMGIAVALPATVALVVYLVGYLIIGGDVLLRAAKNIKRGKVFDENFLMAVATIGAFAIREYPEAVAVMLFYQIGELFQDIAVSKSRASIASLMDIRPDVAWLKVDGDIKQVAAASVDVGDIICVKPGERIPLDGVVVGGKSLIDTSALTGESVPRSIGIDDTALSGAVNQSAVIDIKTTKLYGDSTVARILDLVENATNKKAETEKFITKFARYYTPAVVYMALALAIIPPIFIEGATFADWIHRALIFLVVSCPCALVISIPLGFFGGIGGASRHGILIKGSNYLEALHDVDTVVFDKTGTLTKGVFKVTEVKTSKSMTESDIINLAAKIEAHSNHPIGKSIVKASTNDVTIEDANDVKELSGRGLVGFVDGREVAVGNSKLMQEYDIEVPEVTAVGTVAYVASEKTYVGYIVISDEVKEDSAGAIAALKASGIKKHCHVNG